MTSQTKPQKKSDKELWTLIEESIADLKYVILPHGKIRQKDRSITDIDVLDILENKNNRKRKRNKKKDSYVEGYSDWRYCIEGLDLDEKDAIRIIITFSDELSLLVVTVIRLDNLE